MLVFLDNVITQHGYCKSDDIVEKLLSAHFAQESFNKNKWDGLTTIPIGYKRKTLLLIGLIELVIMKDIRGNRNDLMATYGAIP